MSAPQALIVAGPGTNRDPDAAYALRTAGAEPRVALISDLADDAEPIANADVVVVAGGFSYGDALGAGRMLALDLTATDGGRLGDALRRFVDRGGPVIGICNGFQVLTRAGLLPGALGHNAGGHFDCRWIRLAVERSSPCIWTAHAPDHVECPIAHGEGRYVHSDPAGLAAAGQVVFRYAEPPSVSEHSGVPDSEPENVQKRNGGGNPNGSVADIAGVCDPTGRVLGLMPHPENHVVARQHPRHRGDPATAETLGLGLFQSGVRYVS